MNCQQIRWSFLWVAPLQVEGVEFFETYAPVVQWSTVCALLVMSIVLNLASNAFCQADIDEEVFVEMPKDFGDPRGRGMVLRLNKSLYGTKQAPRTWFLKLKECLEQRGFTQSLLDPCLFIHADMHWSTWYMWMIRFLLVVIGPRLML